MSSIVDRPEFRQMLRWWKANNGFASISFAGTAKGMTPGQFRSLRDILQCLRGEMSLIHFHHGDWIGAVTEAHHFAMSLTGTVPRGTLNNVANGPVIYVHSPDERDAGASNCVGHITRPRRAAYIRNDDLIDESQIFIYAPFTGDTAPEMMTFVDPATKQPRKVLKAYIDHWDAYLKARKRPIGCVQLEPEPYSLRPN
jgi:hypothetical protein